MYLFHVIRIPPNEETVYILLRIHLPIRTKRTIVVTFSVHIFVGAIEYNFLHLIIILQFKGEIT